MSNLFIGDSVYAKQEETYDINDMLKSRRPVEVNMDYLNSKIIEELSPLRNIPPKGSYRIETHDPLKDTVFLDRSTRELVRGRMNVDTAFGGIMASEFIEGIWGENIEHQKFMALMTMGPRSGGWEEDSIYFDVPDEFKETLDFYITTEAGNVTKIFEGNKYGTPIWDLFANDVMDLYEVEQEGFTVMKALEEMAKRP